MSVTPDDGYELDKLTVTKTVGEEDITPSEGYTFAMPSGGATVTATFKVAAQESEKSIEFSTLGYTNGQEVPTIESGDCTIIWNKGSNSNTPKYYDTGAAIRAYGGNYFTVSVAGGTISSIELTFASGEGTNAITTDVGSYDNGTWSGNASSVKFTITGTSGHRRITGITITYTLA